MKNSGLADSPFFAITSNDEPAAAPHQEPIKQTVTDTGQDAAESPMAVGHDDTADVVQKETGHDTVIPRNHDRLVEKLRLAVKQYGKEAATYRFTSEEKDALATAVFATRKRGIRTSENELTRIGVNFILQDFETHGEDSLIARVLEALNA